MESNEDVRAQLREVERGEVASWVVYPPTPAWWPVAAGLWAAAFTLVVGMLDDAAQSFAQLVLVLVLLLAVTWDRRRRGTYPRGAPPRDFRQAILTMLLGIAVVVGATWLVAEVVDVRLAAVLAGVGSWAVVAHYERDYARVAARVRERLS